MLKKFKELAEQHGVQSAEIKGNKLTIIPYANKSYMHVLELFETEDNLDESMTYGEILKCVKNDHFNTQIYEAIFIERD